MVQIIPRVPTPIEQFNKSFGNFTSGVAEAIEALKGASNDRDTRKSLVEKFGAEFGNIKNPELQKLMLQEVLRGKQQEKQHELDLAKITHQETLKDQFKKELLGEKQSFLDQLFGGGKAQQEQGFSQGKGVQPEEGEPQEAQGGFDPTQLSDADIARLAAYDPELGRLVQHEKDVGLREKSAATKAKEKKAADLRAETLPIRKEIADKANLALQGIQNKTQLLDVIRTGKIDDPTYAIIAQALPFRLGERMLSPESIQYCGGIIDEFKDLRSIFQGQTRIKEIELLEDKVAGLYLTDTQKEALLTSRINALRADIIKGEAAAELEEEGKFGGALQFQKMVNARAKPKLDALFNRILDEQKAVIKDAENRKGLPLNYDDPDDRQLLQQLMEESGGDRQKARLLAKKKGYIIGK